MPERSSSSGVPKAPAGADHGLGAHLPTGGVRPAARRGRPPRPPWSGSPARQSSPRARPSSTRTRSTRTPARTRAPAATARGQIGDVGGALGVDAAAERAGAALHAGAGVARDRAAAGAEGRGALHAELPVAPHALGVQRRHREHLLGGARSARRGRSPSRSRRARPTPTAPRSGARKQVPELITVVPPTVRPTGIGIAGLPVAIVSPPSRYISGRPSIGSLG